MQIWYDEWRNSIISLKLYTPVFHMKFINNSVSSSYQEEQYVSYNILVVWTQYNKKICQAEPYNKMMFPTKFIHLATSFYVCLFLFFLYDVLRSLSYIQ
jgi:hypothetical protein